MAIKVRGILESARGEVGRSGGLGWALHDVAKRFLKGMGLIASAHVRDATHPC